MSTIYRFITIPEASSFLVFIIGSIIIIFQKLKNKWVLSHSSPVLQLQNQVEPEEEQPLRKIDKVALNIKARNPILVNSKGIVIGALFFSILTILFTNNFGIDLHLNYLLYYLLYIITSFIIPGIYFLQHRRNFVDALDELRCMIFWNFCNSLSLMFQICEIHVQKFKEWMISVEWNITCVLPLIPNCFL